MTNFIKKLPYTITGDSFEILQRYDSNSRRKISLFSSVILLTSLVWFMTAFLIGYSVLDHSLFNSLLIGLVAFVIIFTVERSIVISSSKSGWILLLRFVMAICVAVLASTFLDLVMFKSDIDNEIKKREIAKCNEILRVSVQNTDGKFQMLNNEMKGGPGSSGKKGYAKISKELKSQTIKSENETSIMKDSLQKTIAALYEPSHPMHSNIMERLGVNTIMYRLKVLEELIEKDSNIRMLFWILFCLGIGIEILPIVIKVTSDATAYDLDLKTQELMFENRRRQVLDNSNHHTRIGLEGREAISMLKSSMTQTML